MKIIATGLTLVGMALAMTAETPSMATPVPDKPYPHYNDHLPLHAASAAASAMTAEAPSPATPIADQPYPHYHDHLPAHAITATPAVPPVSAVKGSVTGGSASAPTTFVTSTCSFDRSKKGFEHIDMHNTMLPWCRSRCAGTHC